MMAAEIINLICILIFIFYWLISSLSVKPTREVSKTFWDIRLVIIILFVLIALLNYFKVFRIIPFVTLTLISPSLFINVISSFLSILGLVIAIIARRTLGKNWSSNVELKKNHELVTYGIYHYVRHPIYTGFILLLLGMMLAVKTLGITILFLFMTGFLLYKLCLEEKLMTKHFPEYVEYKKKTKTLIPFIW